uniref:Uncharacterized protein n=1 Tax=Rhizophora mucronata TaxID=61149 RepID=A0A2P2PEM0_RHIMU
MQFFVLILTGEILQHILFLYSKNILCFEICCVI